MTGRLIAVVGASGVGKDSLIAGLATAQPDLHIVRRVITRPSDLGGEPFEGVTEAEFQSRAQADAFCLSWQAHGLSYGIPQSTQEIVLSGRDAVVNLSRGILNEAATLFPNLIVLKITASPKTLAERLIARGRESREGIERRLSRPEPEMPAKLNIIDLANDGALQETVQNALSALYPERV